MAVTVISAPPVSPALTTVDDAFLITVSSSVYGTAGITQHRFRADVAAILNLGTRYTVVNSSVAPQGTFDFCDLFKTLIFLSPYQWSTLLPITQTSGAIQLNDFPYWIFQVSLSEEYYNSGVFTQVAGPVLVFLAGRGWTDSPTQLMIYDNWYRRNGLTKFMPYTGQTFQVYPQKTEDPSWPSVGLEPWLGLEIAATPGGVLYSVYVSRGAPGWIGVVYMRMYWPGVTDQADFKRLTITVRTSPIASGGTIRDQYDIERTHYECTDPEMLIMFRDSNFQYASMSFTKKHRESITVDDMQNAESITDGRYRYNVEASETLELNTNWMFDEQNVLVKEMMASEEHWLVSQVDGSLTKVVIVPNSLRLQTSRNDGLFQYTVSFRKSKDFFIP